MSDQMTTVAATNPPHLGGALLPCGFRAWQNRVREV